MRSLVLLPLLLPAAGFADVLAVQSRVSDVTLYPESAAIMRRAPFSVPAGHHQLILRDLPVLDDMTTLRVRVDGAEAGTITYRDAHVPPAGLPERPEVIEARERVAAIERQIDAVRDKVKLAEAAGEAARVRLDFLRQLGGGDTAARAGVEALAAIAGLVGRDALKANEEIVASATQAREAGQSLAGLEKELEAARQQLDAVNVEDEDRMVLSVDIQADAPATGEVVLSYLSNWATNWSPVYDARLTTGDAPKVELTRGALVRQETGENWQGVNLTLSTLPTSDRMRPSDLYAWLRVIEDPDPARKSAEDAAASPEPSVEAPVIVESASSGFATVHSDRGVSYVYGQPVSLASGADIARLTLDAVTLDVALKAVAVPERDTQGYLVAHVTNRTGEEILAGSTALLHVDGEYVGTGEMPAITAGDTADLPFGPIRDLKLSVRRERGAGETGILSKSNTDREQVWLEVRNLSPDRAWTVRVLGQVPYSEQDALEIAWTADPKPAETDVDGQRGILGWDVTVEPGATRTISLRTEITWPLDKVLR